MIVAILDSKPIFVSDKIFVEWYLIAKRLFEILHEQDETIEKLDNLDLFNFSQTNLIKNLSPQQFLSQYNVKVYKSDSTNTKFSELN